MVCGCGAGAFIMPGRPIGIILDDCAGGGGEVELVKGLNEAAAPSIMRLLRADAFVCGVAGDTVVVDGVDLLGAEKNMGFEASRRMAPSI